MTDDDLDRRILAALLADGRASVRSLARSLDVPVPTVADRLEALEEDGPVEGYRPEVNYAALGYDAGAVFRLQVAPGALPAVLDLLAANDRLRSVYEVAGPYDVVAVGTFADAEERRALTEELMATPGVEATTVDAVERTVADHDPVAIDPEDGGD